MKKKSFKPQLESISQIQEFVGKSLVGQNYDKKKFFKIELLIEEIVVNIINYAFKNRKKGNIIIETDTVDDKLILRILDDGAPFNLLEAKEPDITASLEDRKPGGLGIFFVKQLAQHLEYSYQNSKNCISLIIEP